MLDQVNTCFEEEGTVEDADAKDIFGLGADFADMSLETLKPSGHTTARNDFNDAQREMSISVAKCDHKNNTEDMEAIMMNGWVEKEDSIFCCQQVLAK